MQRLLSAFPAWCAAAWLFSGFCAYARPTPARPALSPFEHADRLHAALEEQPQEQRTRRDYEGVLDAYRFIYHSNPASAKADASISAVAGLLEEEGRLFHSEKAVHDAVAQYEFLRREYPTSRYRFSALLAEGEIYRTDLEDPDQAAAAFQQFIEAYPRNALAAQARIELKAIRPDHRYEDQRGETSLPAPVVMNSGFDSDSGNPLPNRHGRPRVTSIRDWSNSNSTRIAIDLDAQVEYQEARVSHPERIYFDLRDAHLAQDLVGKSIVVRDGGFLKRIRAAQYSAAVTRIVLDVSPGTDYSAFFLPNPWRLMIDIHARNRTAPSVNELAANELAANELASLSGANLPAPVRPVNERAVTLVTDNAPQAAQLNPLRISGRENELDELAGMAVPAPAPAPMDMPAMRAARPAADGEPSLARTLGLKIGRIVIDPGHGGYDSGTLGPGGVEEKDITLDIALRLGRLLKRRLGEDVVYTRETDTFIPLETRTAIANRSHADLFISVHANSSSDPSARGVESYYLNFTTSPEALEVAARENVYSNESIYELSDLVKKITLRDKVEESREFAEDVQQSLYKGMEAGNPGLKDRGVKKAPFVVLIGANMPSILAEISFLTNPDDARELRQPAYRERIAESLYRGVARYINGLNGVRLAQNSDNPGN